MLLAMLMLQLAAPEGVTMVFFDWGKTEISRDSEATLEKVVQDYRANRAPLLLTGHSDRSGPSGANLQSSRQRAQIVADYLASKGVPRSAMTIEGRGEEAPIIATEDGVREVQNRRVEIRRR
ncbi:OmpA family protein [Sphingomonas sp. HDW15A]|uniref:OmpA family protein n=1 Tax=Sphingomonas sp. HDW15A TaxID=2714942 RepID=UPI0014078CB3|nr:OmpA family protein [Sphingomonas sp. HDW15A]QIK95535.1 OmpA family protein [Sphingomonas sp. HDW15A]